MVWLSTSSWVSKREVDTTNQPTQLNQPILPTQPNQPNQPDQLLAAYGQVVEAGCQVVPRGGAQFAQLVSSASLAMAPSSAHVEWWKASKPWKMTLEDYTEYIEECYRIL